MSLISFLCAEFCVSFSCYGTWRVWWEWLCGAAPSRRESRTDSETSSSSSLTCWHPLQSTLSEHFFQPRISFYENSINSKTAVSVSLFQLEKIVMLLTPSFDNTFPCFDMFELNSTFSKTFDQIYRCFDTKFGSRVSTKIRPQKLIQTIWTNIWQKYDLNFCRKTTWTKKSWSNSSENIGW